jgi:hypothetical protein
MKTGRLFKNEREDGTIITTINLAGSQFDFDFMLEHCKDHVLIIQEHWRLKDDIHTWESMAYRKGWQGIWEPAKQTEKNNDGVTGRSGGVAVLTWNGRLIMKNTFESDYRVLGVSIGWGRKKTLHIFAIYGYDTGQKDKFGQSYHERGNRSIRDRLGRFITQLGRVPWIIGGDWNMAPGTCVIEGMNNAAAYLDPMGATCNTGSTLDWFMVSGGLAIGAETQVDNDTHIYSHYPVRLKIGGKLSEDLGHRIRKVNAFEGMTKKEVKKSVIPEGDFQTKEGTLEENWARWNLESEKYLCIKEDKKVK